MAMSETMTNLLTDVTQDARIETIKALVEARLKNKLGGLNEIPAELEYIVTEVTISRFNRVGSEGLSSHSVEGEQQDWSQDDFAPYESDIQNWLDLQKSASKGRIVFL